MLYLLKFYLAFYLIHLRRFFVVEVRGNHFDLEIVLRVRQGPLRSCALHFRSGSDNSDPGLAGRVGRNRCDLALAVEVRQPPL